MPHEICIPRLGWSSEECKFIGWLKQPGEAVAIGDLLFEVESEKALVQIESVDAGKLHIPAHAPEPGGVFPVGALLGYLLAADESIPDVNDQGESPSKSDQIRDEESVTVVDDRAQSIPINRSASRPIASPRARRVAADLGIDWTNLRGSGQGGRIRERDVREAGPASEAYHPGVVSITPRRQAIGDRLRASQARSIPVTLTTIADATNLVALRQQFKKSDSETVPSYTDIVAFLVARILIRRPQMASRWDSDHRSLNSAAGDQIHIGIAVDTHDGLLVAVLRDVARRSLLDIATESKQQIKRARTGRLTAADMQGSVFTISNLGAFGIDAFTPVINAPEVAILGLGAIRREPVVMPDDQVVPRHRMTLSFTFDHAAVDGAPAAAFLRDIARALENPDADLW
jgi:pyruvate dehydrogenase E2 component (dihydrolipoamide acetyltransferase)